MRRSRRTWSPVRSPGTTAPCRPAATGARRSRAGSAGCAGRTVPWGSGRRAHQRGAARHLAVGLGIGPEGRDDLLRSDDLAAVDGEHGGEALPTALYPAERVDVVEAAVLDAEDG